jgi:hypothetical protein
VTHLDVSAEQIDEAVARVRQVVEAAPVAAPAP